MDIDQNYFELFGLAAVFAVDETLLSERYRQLQKEIHPDRFAGKGEREQRLAVQFTTYVNEAFQGLKSPLKRAEYLLLLAGVEVDPQNETTSDAVFLMEQMELRETLGEIPESSDPEAALESMSAQVDKHLDELLVEFEHNFDVKQFDECKAVLSKLYFVKKLADEIEQLDAKLFDY
jgi:molecular chaperone HscB